MPDLSEAVSAIKESEIGARLASELLIAAIEQYKDQLIDATGDEIQKLQGAIIKMRELEQLISSEIYSNELQVQLYS